MTMTHTTFFKNKDYLYTNLAHQVSRNTNNTAGSTVVQTNLNTLSKLSSYNEPTNTDTHRPQTTATHVHFEETQTSQLYNIKQAQETGIKPAPYINAIPRIQRKPRNPLKTINYQDY